MPSGSLTTVAVMIALFTQSLGQRIEHTVSETVVRQQVMAFAPLVEASDSNDARNIGTLVLVGERSLYESLEGCRIFVLENDA